MKKAFPILIVILIGIHAFLLPVSASDVSLEQEKQKGLIEQVSLSSSGVFNSFVCNHVTMEREYFNLGQGSGSASVCTMKFEDREASAISTRYPQNVTADARYVAIKYYSAGAPGQTIGLTWRDSNADQHHAQVYLPQGDMWAVAIVDMQAHSGWSGKISNVGFTPGEYFDQPKYFGLVWLKFFEENPIELYGSEASMVELTYTPSQTQPPVTEPEQTSAPEPGIELDTEWETFATETAMIFTESLQTEQQTRPGLLYEAFGEDILPGCQRQSLGCGAGGCTAIAGGLAATGLIALGIVLFKKKE